MSDILVVADEDWVIDGVRSALSEPRFTVREISDPRQVVEGFDTARPDAVIVDMQIGSMGGMAVTRAIRNSAAVARVPAPPVLMLLDRDADAFLAGRSGAAAWVRKPFGASDLRAAIDGALELSA